MKNHMDSEWLNKPWMYFKPKNAESLTKWRETWINFILTHAKQKNIHLIHVSDLRQEFPFYKMSNEAFDDIIEALVQQGNGSWWDKKRGQLRIHWCSLEKWAEHITQKAKSEEKTVIIGIKGIIELEPTLNTMPEKEIENIITIMVKRNYAHWIDKNKKIVKIN